MKKLEQQNLDESVERNILERINSIRRDGNDGYISVVTDSELKEIEKRAKERGIDPWKKQNWRGLLKEIQEAQ